MAKRTKAKRKSKAKDARERWVVNTAMHLGLVKYSVSVGTVIEFDPAERKMYIDGQSFEDIRDLEILKNNGWVDEYSEAGAKATKQRGEQQEAERDARMAEMKEPATEMPVVQSDSDDHDIIDISHTRKEKDTGTREVSNDMEIIRGDEPIEERIARLNAEKAEKDAMPVVRDDSLGDGVGGQSLNAGAVTTKTAEEHERLRKEGQEKAAKGFTDERVVAATPEGVDVSEGEAEVADETTPTAKVAKKAHLDVSMLED